MQPALDILRLVRIGNCLMAGAAVWIGAYLTWLIPNYHGPLFASLAAFFVCTFGNCLNDILDLDIDRVNRPDRVLVRGGVGIRAAWAIVVVAAVLALGFALLANMAVTVCVTVALVLLVGYNVWLKRIPVAGNLLIGVLSGLTFVAGGLAIDVRLTTVLPGPLVPAVFALLFHLVRELVKDVQDIEGDRRAGVYTLPQLIGTSRTLMIALMLFFLLALLTYIPILNHWYGAMYKILAVYCMDLPLLALLVIVWGNPTPKLLTVASVALKVGMLVGLVALVLG